jgi:SOS response regulatory protein OraA/RecX
MAKSCYEYAIWVIWKYPKTEKELRIKMYQQWYDTETVNRIMEKLKADNFVNDELFAESYINSEVIKKWRPLLVITQKLEQRWIDKSIISQLTHDLQEEIENWTEKGIEREIAQYKKRGVDWFDIIQKLMRKWYRLWDIKRIIKKNNSEE